MKKRTIKVLLLVAMLAFAIALTACGGGDDNDADASIATGTGGGDTNNNAGGTDNNVDTGGGDVVVTDRDLSALSGTEIFVFHQSFGPRFDEDVADFEALHNVTIRGEATPWDQYYSRLMSLIMAGDSPDIFDSSDEILPMYALRQIAQSIDGLYTPGAPFLDFDVMRAMQYRGRTYMMQEIGRLPIVIFYNQTLFNRYGQPTPMELYRAGEWTVDRMFSLASEFVADVTNSGEFDQFGYVGTSVFHIFGANQLDITAYDPIAGQFELNIGDEQQIAIMQHAIDHIERRDIEPFGWTAGDLFPRGRLAMASHEIWFANSLVAMEDEWSVAPMPTGQFGNTNYNFIRPWGASVATGASNPLGGIAFTEFQYARNLEQNAAFTGVWTGDRGEALRIASDKNSFFSLHNGIPHFRPLADAISHAMTPGSGRTATDLVNENRSAMQQAINDFNEMIEGWVDPRMFENPGPHDFSDGTLGYLTMPVYDNVTQTIIENEDGSFSLHIELAEAGWWPIFGTGINDLEVVGGQAYHITFDYHIIRTASGTAMFYTQVNPGQEGWTDHTANEGDRGRFDRVVAANTDSPDMWIAICNYGVLELVIDNFNIVVVEN